MNIRNFSNTAFMRHVIDTRKKYGQRGTFPIDQTPSQKFNIDPATGRPMSDIQKLVKIQDSVSQQALFSQLKELKSEFLPKDMTDEQAITFLKSRYCQTKSQLLDYKENLAKYQLNQQQILAEKQAKLAKEKADAEFLESLRKDIVESKSTKS